MQEGGHTCDTCLFVYVFKCFLDTLLISFDFQLFSIYFFISSLISAVSVHFFWIYWIKWRSLLPSFKNLKRKGGGRGGLRDPATCSREKLLQKMVITSWTLIWVQESSFALGFKKQLQDNTRSENSCTRLGARVGDKTNVPDIKNHFMIPLWYLYTNYTKL